MWQGEYFVDRNLEMGLASSCKIFEQLSSALEWIAKTKLGIHNIVHILDDFLLMDQTESGCNTKLIKFLSMCHDIGVPIAKDKTFPPNTTMTFVGYELDTVLKEARLPIDKLVKCSQLIDGCLKHPKITLRNLQSIIGTLNFCCNIVVCGRAFLRRLINLTMGIKRPYYFIRITKSVQEDLQAWKTFLNMYNCKSFFLPDRWIQSPAIHLYTDASGNHGYGGVLGSHWFFGPWDDSWRGQNITLLELYPIVIAIHIWGTILSNKCIYFHTDNIAVAAIMLCL